MNSDLFFRNKKKKIIINNRVSIKEDNINLTKVFQEKEIQIPKLIKYEYLYNIDINDVFFNSLKADYKDFSIWYKNKSLSKKRAYITRGKNNNIGSFLMLKVEDENEDYSNFKEPFEKNLRLKVATFKVSNTGNKIGESYIKIIINEAIKNKVNEIYLTIFNKQEELINLFKKNGFVQKTTKMTIKSDLSVEEELVLVKKMNDKT